MTITRIVELNSPVNKDHPLNKNLRAWYYIPDSRFVANGSVFNILNREYNKGTIVGTYSYCQTQRNSIGFRQLSSTSYVAIPSGVIPGDSANTQGTVCGWVRAIGKWSGYREVRVWSSRNLDLGLYGSGNIVKPHSWIFTSTDIYGAATNDTRWLWLAATVKYNGTMELYVNGVNVASASVGAMQTQSSGKFWTYSDQTTNQQDWNGPYEFDDTRVYDRQLSAIEIANLYDESLHGNPTTLNYSRGRKKAYVSGYLRRRTYNSILGSGVLS